MAVQGNNGGQAALQVGARILQTMKRMSHTTGSLEHCSQRVGTVDKKEVGSGREQNTNDDEGKEPATTVVEWQQHHRRWPLVPQAMPTPA
jgi:hypothetical protein